jgi:SAM-dependent methyltransferase
LPALAWFGYKSRAAGQVSGAMAVDFNTAKFLLWAKNLGVNFSRTATLGHLGLNCPPRALRRAAQDFGIPATGGQINRCFLREPCKDVFADEFFRILGAGELVTIDRSDFEGATFLHDLNEPFPESMRGRFDLVLDSGTLEHIFNYQAALKHSLELLRVGGHFITVTPANGFMGHGFYQFSPELFFGVFNEQNGFVLRKIVLFETFKGDSPFYEVNNPAVIGRRVELNASGPVLMAVLAQKTADVPILARPPQQSDYVAAWSRPAQAIDQSTALGKWRVALNPYWPAWLRKLKTRLTRRGEPATLNNPRSFRRLSRKAVADERQESASVSPGLAKK